MKKFILIMVIILISSVLYAKEISRSKAIKTTPAAQPSYADKFGIGYSWESGLNFRFWPGEHLGFELPISSSLSGTDEHSDFQWNVKSGFNIIFPLTKIYGMYLFFVPGITFSAEGRSTGWTKSTSGGVTVLEEQHYKYTFSGGITLGFEAEIFLNAIYDKLPSNISVGSKFAFNGSRVMTQTWTHDVLNNEDKDFHRTWFYNAGITAIGTSLFGLNIRYYF